MVDINVMGCDLAAKNLKDNPLFITEIKGGSYFQNMRKDVAHELIDTRILRVSYFDVMYYLDKVLNSIPEQKLDVLLFVRNGLLLAQRLYPLLILIFNIWLEANCYKMKEGNKL